MHLTLRQLTLFESVARNLSYTRAAEELHLSQPAVSMQIRQLEDSAGLPLFERLGKSIYMTEAGEEMYTYSRNISQQLQELDDVMEALKGVQGGRLRLSVASTANSFATRILSAFSKLYTGTTYSLDVTNRKSLLDQLANNQTDIVIMGKPPEDLGIKLEVEAFMENPLVIIAPPNHPLANSKKPISLERLIHEPFVMREKDSGTRIAMERFFREKGLEIETGMEMTSNSAIKQSVTAGLGLGVVSYHTLELELEAKRLTILNVEGFPIRRQWHVVHLSGKRLPPVAKAFLDFLAGDAAKPLLEFNYPSIDS